MSTLFGLHVPGAPDVLQAGIRTMMAAMDYWQADGRNTIHAGDLALGHLLLHNTPESIGEAQPYHLDGYWIAADARIDNREELHAFLKAPVPGGLKASDAALILHLYRENGSEIIARLRGDFAFAIWDRQRGELLCARDQMGVKNLFYGMTATGFAFASEIRGIISLPGADRTVDEAFVDCLLTDDDPSGDQTFYRSIKRLLPGHLLTYRGREPRIQRYWTPQLPSLLKLSSKADYLEAFREGLRTAVKRRLRSAFPMAAELSGGLDSSGVTCLASSLVDDPGRLYTFSNVLSAGPDGQKPYRDEEAHIDAVLRHCGIRQSVKITSSGREHPLDYHDLELEVNRGVDVYSAWWMEPMRREMSARNIRVSLSGFGGDEAITNRSGWYYRDYLLEGRYFRFLEAAIRGRHYTTPIRSMLKSMAPGLVRRIAGHAPNRRERISYLKQELPGAGKRDKGPRAGTSAGGYRAYLLGMLTRDYTWQRIQSEGLFSIRHRLEPRYPLIDLDLLELFLSMPLDMLGHPGQDRFLYREAMKGILPEMVRLRRDKLVSAGIYYLQESRDNAPFFLEWLRERQAHSDSGRSARIDIPAMIRGWDPENQQNCNSTGFRPRGSFRAECLLRLDELVELQHLPWLR